MFCILSPYNITNRQNGGNKNGKTELDKIKERVKDFNQYLLNDYHHKDWISPYKGSEIYGLITSSLDYIEALEKRISVLENKDQQVTPLKVKELRTKTGCSMIQCKQALILFVCSSCKR